MPLLLDVRCQLLHGAFDLKNFNGGCNGDAVLSMRLYSQCNVRWFKPRFTRGSYKP